MTSPFLSSPPPFSYLSAADAHQCCSCVHRMALLSPDATFDFVMDPPLRLDLDDLPPLPISSQETQQPQMVNGGEEGGLEAFMLPPPALPLKTTSPRSDNSTQLLTPPSPPISSSVVSASSPASRRSFSISSSSSSRRRVGSGGSYWKSASGVVVSGSSFVPLGHFYRKQVGRYATAKMKFTRLMEFKIM